MPFTRADYRPAPMSPSNGTNDDDPVARARVFIATTSSYTEEEERDVLASTIGECLDVIEVLCAEIERLRAR